MNSVSAPVIPHYEPLPKPLRFELSYTLCPRQSQSRPREIWPVTVVHLRIDSLINVDRFPDKWVNQEMLCMIYGGLKKTSYRSAFVRYLMSKDLHYRNAMDTFFDNLIFLTKSLFANPKTLHFCCMSCLNPNAVHCTASGELVFVDSPDKKSKIVEEVVVCAIGAKEGSKTSVLTSILSNPFCYECYKRTPASLSSALVQKVGIDRWWD